MFNITAAEQYNPWWTTGELPARFTSTVPREMLSTLCHGLDHSRASVVIGTRRVGKTVLLHQIVGRLLARGIPPRQIVYVSADDPLLGSPADLLPGVAGLLDQTTARKGETAFALIDEIHSIPNWALYVKRFIDLGTPIAWVLSSSAGSLLYSGARESLVGRAQDYRLLPFSLAETARLVGSPAMALLEKVATIWRETGLDLGDAQALGQLSVIHDDALGHRADIESLVARYLREGGFPEYVTMPSAETRHRYFWDSVVERVLVHDTPTLGRVRHPAALRELLARLLAQGPSLINIQALASELGINHLTAADYLRIIEMTMLDFILDRHAATLAGRQRGTKKSVPLDPAFTTALSGWDLGGPQRTTYEGRLAEIVVHSWLRRHQRHSEIRHWREKDHEVDFVIARPDALIPVEVKWRPRERSRAVPGLEAFAHAFGPGRSLTVTRDAFAIQGAHVQLPLWMLG